MKYLAWLLLGAFFIAAAIVLYPDSGGESDALKFTPGTVRAIMTQSGSPMGRSTEVAMLPNPFAQAPQTDGGAKAGQSICQTWRQHYNAETGFAPATVRQLLLRDPGQRSVLVEALAARAMCRAVREQSMVPCTDLATLLSPSDINSCMLRSQILLGTVRYNSLEKLSVPESIARLATATGGSVSSLVTDVVSAFASVSPKGCEDAMGMRLGNAMLAACTATVSGDYDACNALSGVEDNLWCEQSARVIRGFRAKNASRTDDGRRVVSAVRGRSGPGVHRQRPRLHPVCRAGNRESLRRAGQGRTAKKNAVSG